MHTPDGAALDGPALERALGEHKFDQAKTQLMGMVKASENEGHVSFAPGGCESWVDIPSAMINEAEHLGDQPCKERSHPVFRLSLNEPTDPQAKVLMQLLAARWPLSGSMPAIAPQLAGLPGASPQGPSGVMRTRGCSTWCYGSTLICACPVYIPGRGYGLIVYACGTCISDPVVGGVFTA